MLKTNNYTKQPMGRDVQQKIMEADQHTFSKDTLGSLRVPQGSIKMNRVSLTFPKLFYVKHSICESAIKSYKAP